MIPSGWTERSFAQCGTWLSGGTPNTNNPAFWGGDIPWISASSLVNFLISDSERRITPLGAANGTRLVPPGTILFVVRGMSLKTEFRLGITQRTVAFGQDSKAVIPAQDVDGLFLAYAVKSKSPVILGMVDEASHGTGRLQTGPLQNLVIGLPPVSEQRAIAGILGALDEKIELNRRTNETLDGMARALFNSWFVGFDPVRAKVEGRSPAGIDTYTSALFPERLAPTALGHTPVGWRVAPLGELLELKRGYDLPAAERRTGGVPIISSSGVCGCHDEAKVKAPGVVTGRYGTIGQVFWVDQDFWPLNTALYVRDFKGNSPTYVYHVLRGFDFEKFSDKAAVPGINRNHVHLEPVCIAPPEIQIRFEEMVQMWMGAMREFTAESRTLITLRDQLLPRLISGEIRVRDADRLVEATL